jgi:hypothetical protein
LRSLGASQNTIALEEKRLQELQGLCYKYFRRDMIQVRVGDKIDFLFYY